MQLYYEPEGGAGALALKGKKESGCPAVECER